MRASSFDEPLTATGFAPRPCSDHGSARQRALSVDGRGYFVARDGMRLFKLEFNGQRNDFDPSEITRLKQEMCSPGVVSFAFQREPDMRLHAVLADGRMIVIVMEANEDVAAMVPYTMGADVIERVAVLPGLEEDRVYVYVRRGTARCLEKFAIQREALGGAFSKVMDSHVVYAGPSTTVITGLGHLAGRSVVAWSNGPLATQAAPLTVSVGGTVTLPSAVVGAVVGLPYDGMIKTSKLAQATPSGTSLTMAKRIGPLGLVMADVGWKGVKVGRDFDHMTGLPATYRGRPLGAGEVIADWDAAPASFNGAWGPDPRVCIKIEAPYPCSVMGIVFGEAVYEGQDAAPPRQRG